MSKKKIKGKKLSLSLKIYILDEFNIFILCRIIYNLPQFLSDLEAAGINEVIEANQEQLDAWLAEQE